MPSLIPQREFRHATAPPGGLTRRRFLAGLGLLAGAGALAPWLRRAGARRMVSVEVSRPLLGTWVRVVARHEDGACATRAVERAFAAIRAVDAQMSIHRADSQLVRVNRAAGAGAARVDGAVLDVVERALAAAQRTAGVYDPSVLPPMRAYGFYGAGGGRLPTDRQVAAALERMGWRHVRVDRARGELALAREGMGLDLGSIGKGWAVERAVAALRAEGVRSGLVDAGGNVYGLGAPEDGADGWSVGVEHPLAGRMDKVFVLRDAAVATSGNTEQFRILGGVRVGHLFDARRGRPAAGHLSATVRARGAVAADVMSTAAFLLGPDRFRGWPEALDVHFIG
jgi:thiamine biosynthesis lipoprotein